MVVRRRVRPAAPDLRQPPRSRAHRLLRHVRRHPVEADASTPWRSRSRIGAQSGFKGDGRCPLGQGHDLRGRQGARGRRPRRCRGAARGTAREAGRVDLRDRRRPDYAVPGGRTRSTRPICAARCAPAVATGALVPVLCGSAMANIGVAALLDAIVDLCPSPVERPAPIDAQGQPVNGHLAGSDLQDRLRPLRPPQLFPHLWRQP